LPNRSAPAGDLAVVEVPTVTVRTRRHEERVVITINDQGTGIAPDDMAHIFDPYCTTRRAGTGLGLPISRNIIEGLGGRITVASEHGRGTDVRIELPLDGPSA
jgi:C4-dicarboxylate-specific signal transduction histidine kinase